MNTFVKIILFVAGIFVVYGFFTNSWQVPGIGVFLLVPLLLCVGMMLFMNHGGTDKKEGEAHHH